MCIGTALLGNKFFYVALNSFLYTFSRVLVYSNSNVGCVFLSHVYLYMPVTEPSQTAFEPLIKEECPNSLKTMASDKPLGLMTFRPNFIKFSGVTLKVIYLICLSISQRRGLITLLPPPQKKTG